MNFNKILGYFVPDSKKFYVLFEKCGENTVDIAHMLKILLQNPSLEERKLLAQKVHELENKGDSIVHEIMVELSSNFITPFDREDIHHLASSIDNIADYIYATSKRMALYNLEEITPPMFELANLIIAGAEKLNEAIKGLRSLNNFTKIKSVLVEINSIENQADEVYNQAIADLFANEKDAIKLFKYHEILGLLEEATDCCEDVADAIQTIIVKHS